MRFEDTSYDADLVATQLSDISEELGKLRLVLERGVLAVERIASFSTAGTAS